MTTQNRDTAVIFADGAGAVCIEARETGDEVGILASAFHAEKVYNNIQQYGNTTAAAIPIALDELMEKKMLKSGDHVMVIGPGAGLTRAGLYTGCPDLNAITHFKDSTRA